MTETEDTTDEQYTIDVNGKRYALNEEFREAIQRRAELAYEDNMSFSCWWSVAHEDNYTDEAWENNNHENGDPLLVIETEGPIVPWNELDELEMEMEDISQPVDDDTDRNDIDSGNGMKTIPPEDALGEDDDGEERTHFSLTPRDFEDVPQPEGEHLEKLPPKPEKMGDEPSLVWWIPRHPDIQERWSTGEAIVPAYNWVEWNIQARADEIRFSDDEVKPNSHDHFESLCKSRDCEVVGEYTVSQNTPNGESGSVKRKGKKSFEEGKYGGDNFHV